MQRLTAPVRGSPLDRLSAYRLLMTQRNPARPRRPLPPAPRALIRALTTLLGRPPGPGDYRRVAYVVQRGAYGGGASGALGILAYAAACRHWAFTDHMTKVGNRRSFDFGMWDYLGRARRRDAPLSLILFAIDHFKKLNDGLGHQAGDEALRSVGRALKRAKIGHACRYGGEEFVVYLPDTSAEVAVQVADDLRARIASAWTRSSLTASAGVAVYPTDGKTSSELIDAADKALYRSKSEGRNRTTLAG